MLLSLACLSLAVQPARGQTDGIDLLLNQLETALKGGDVKAFGHLMTLAPDDEGFQQFTESWFATGTTRATVHERDRAEQGSPDALRLIVEVLVEAGIEGRLATWRLDVRRGTDGWKISALHTLSIVDGLFRLSIDKTTQYRAKDLVVTAEDIQIRLSDGVVFLANVPSGPTVAILLGKGDMVFSPNPEAEQRQIALLTGGPSLHQSFDAAMIRLNPADAANRLPASALSTMSVNSGQLARAEDIFAEEIGKSFSVDLADLSRETWSLVPSVGDILAEVRTRQYGTLTYTHDGTDQEDITFFDRARRRNFAVYSSRSKLATRGPFYDEDARAEFDVLDYNVDTSFVPDRFWMEGQTRLRLRVRAFALSAMTIRLAERLVVRSVKSDKHGRLLYVRVRNQNSLIVNLPEAVNRDDEFTIIVSYAGRHEPQGLERENVTVDAQVQTTEVTFEPEPHYLYSTRSYWYAQATQSDYATATIRFTVPAQYATVCSGEPAAGSPVQLRPVPNEPLRRLFVFAATAPVRYLSCVVSRFNASDARDADVGAAKLPIRITSTTRQRGRGREVLSKAAEMMEFYGTLMGDTPYPSLSIAVLESQVPGGHAPGYVAMINQPLPSSPFVWRDDPASFDEFPDFFLAHELAHQWWGQAVGWKNYHEQWLSEGFAQYFAALFAEKRRGADVFDDVVRQLAKWTLAESDQGPVYLGSRLGQLKGEARVFRALVYNKGGAVLHMLRRLLGDEVFFNGVRRFYREFKFKKAGTEDLRRALEAESGRSLETFFRGWIHKQDLPTVTLTWRSMDDARVKIELQQSGDPLEFPVSVTRVYADGTEETETVTVSSALTTVERPATGGVKSIEVNRDRMTRGTG